MFNLIFGLVWTIFSTFCFGFMFVDGGTFEPATIPFILLFEGIVLRTLRTGSSVNDVPELKAEVLAYLEYERTTKIFEQVNRNLVPNYIFEELETEYFDKGSPKTIEVNGVTYVRADLIEVTDLNKKF